MQAEAAQIIEQTGVVDKLLGPSGGFVLALLGLGAVVWHHTKTIQKHAERLEEKDLEIRRLAEARVEEAKGEARDMIARMEAMDDAEGKRWSKLARILALPEPLGVTMGRLELMMRAIAKKAGAATPQQPSPGTSTQSNLQMMDGDEDGGVSMF